MRGGAVALRFLFVIAALAACAKSAPTPALAPARHDYARWESLLRPPPELLVVVRPQALQKDQVYGALVARAIELAREHTPFALTTGALDAIEDAEEVIVGVRDSGQDRAGDLFVVVRGVRGNIDPASLVDEMGRALWAAGPDGPAANVRELLRAPATAETAQGAVDAADASLFELPGRTWVIATGKARALARDALALPARVESSEVGDPLATTSAAVALVRLSGPALVARIRTLRPPGLLAPLGHKLGTVTVVLSSGDDGFVRTTLAYTDPHAVAPAEATLRAALAALIAAKVEEYAWLHSATVERSSCCVVITALVPGPQSRPRRDSADAPARSPAKLELPL